MSIQLLNQRKISDHKKLRSLCSDLVVCVLLSWTWVRVTNLDVRLDCDFILDKHINSIIKASFYHFINFSFQTFSKIQIHFPPPQFWMSYFITTNLDYCNAHYIGLSKASLACLQLVQNAAVRL